jgi:hypothetical protein
MLLVVSGAIAACYKPTIGDRLRCADAGAHACPEGFVCERTSGYCRRTLTEGGVDNRETGPDGMDGGQPEVPTICFDARPNCQPDDAGVCDPVCQTGCGCVEKCSVNTGGALTCNVLTSGLQRGLLQNCERFNPGAPTQADACNPGLVCLAGADDGCGGRCYQFCRVESDCSNAPCDKSIAGGRKVCDVPFVTCNPVMPVSGCPGAQSCYLSTSHPTRTICDCAGAVAQNDPCNRSRDCFPGLVCVDPSNTGDFRCRQVCLLSTNGSECPGGAGPNRCEPFMGNSTTMTNTTYGFCN